MQRQWCSLQIRVMNLENRFVFWSETLGAYLVLSVRLERNFKAAVCLDNLIHFFQPQIQWHGNLLETGGTIIGICQIVLWVTSLHSLLSAGLYFLWKTIQRGTSLGLWVHSTRAQSPWLCGTGACSEWGGPIVWCQAGSSERAGPLFVSLKYSNTLLFFHCFRFSC